MLLEAYFDDSGQEADKHNNVVCIAGYMSLSGAWDDFNDKWERALLRHELPEIHMKNWRSVCQNRKWDTGRSGAVLGDFIDIIRGAGLWGFGCGVDAHQWQKLPREKRKTFGSAQEFLMQRLFRMIIEGITDQGLDADINLVFDQDEAFSKPRLTRYFGIKRLDPLAKRHATIISFADARRCPSLQAADILASLTRSRLRDRHQGKPSTDIWNRLMADADPAKRELVRNDWEGWFGDNVEAELDAAAAEIATLVASSLASAKPKP